MGGLGSNPGDVVFGGATPKCAVTLTERRAKVGREAFQAEMVAS